MRCIHLTILAALSVAALASSGSQPTGQSPELLSVAKIWDAAGHNAFTDLIRFRGQWFCVFREADGHVRGNGRIRLLRSTDGEQWSSAALVSEDGIDLRDPKLSVTPDDRLMLLMGGSVYNGKTLQARRSRVAFSSNGTDWPRATEVLDKGDWLWRVTWRQRTAYGLAYASGPANPGTNNARDWRVKLVASDDGVNYRTISELKVPGRPNEGTLRFLTNGDCVALLRREVLPGNSDKDAWVGLSHPPYRDWKWHSAGLFIGGPDFVVLPDGRMVAGGRCVTNEAGPRCFVGSMNLEGVQPRVQLPSGGDCSYPGLVWEQGLLWVSYYSSHEGKASIYLARVRWP